VDLGKRLAVFGVWAVGKSTLSRRISAATGIEMIRPEHFSYLPDGRKRPLDEYLGLLHEALVSRPVWICDGYGDPNEMAIRKILAEADSVIWLHLPQRVSLGRLVLRTVRRGNTIRMDGKRIWHGPRARVYDALLILRETFQTPALNRMTRRLLDEARGRRGFSLIELRSSPEVADFLLQLEAKATGQARGEPWLP
jgi:hypothetical protein